MAEMAVDQPEGPTESMIQRFTKGGRELWYKLSVLQQPMRARACGSGMKANSDRRPVDPPPVIELKIFEGSPELKKEITFDYNANFFLFASLQQARTIAQGRGMPPPTNSAPVLTGVPVAGMAYLDRPSAAGSFIFPDLSVRHEGCFNLSFSLFETTKEEKDMDRDPVDAEAASNGVDWRMEVKTKPFFVFSAKKFPGLMESTDLSKVVADQGCRVRIRRDVRMRKRDGKGNGGRHGGHDNSDRHGNGTPSRDERARSNSAASGSRMPYPHDHKQRPGPPEGYAAPLPQAPFDHNHAGPTRGHLAFGERSSHYYSTPHHSNQLPPLSPSGPYGPPAHHMNESPSYRSQNSISSRASPAPLLPDASHHRQASGSGTMPPSPSAYPLSDMQSRRGSLASVQSSIIGPLPPTRSHVTAEPSRGMKIHQLVSPPLPPIEARIEPSLPALPLSAGDKRKHDAVFSQNSRPLFNGKRQADPHYEQTRLNGPETIYLPSFVYDTRR